MADEKKKDTKKPAPKKPPFYVAEGASVTSKKGILCAGDEVKAEFLRGESSKNLDKLVACGVVIKS